ncbi:MAG: ZIP family metal transporter [Thaumarchaeota archaeon]|nr:ZIP family metal transporter [Nitrososphaerota archaeon]
MGLEQLFYELAGGNLILLAGLGGLFTSLLNVLGALPILVLRGAESRLPDLGLGFAAGVMLAASFTSLIIPGIRLGGVFPVLIGIGLGAILVSLMDRLIPHMHAIIGVEGISSRLRAIWLFILAITIHNVPEGLAVGVGLGSGDLASGIALMIAIALQNIPEGLSVGLSLIATGSYSRGKAYLASSLSGLVELPLALIGGLTVASTHKLIPYAMGFAAGAMIFVVSDEIIPEVHRLGREKSVTYSLIIGLLVMLLLDSLLSA